MKRLKRMSVAAVVGLALAATAWAQDTRKPDPVAPAGAASSHPAAATPAAPTKAPPVPFYGLYAWCSDIGENKWLLDAIKDVGFRFISSAIDDDKETEHGLLLCAQNGIMVAGIVGPNRYAAKMDLDGWRAELRKQVERYGPGGTFWKEHPDVPANPILYWCFTCEPGTEMKPPGDMMPDEEYFKFMQAGHEVLKAYNRDLRIVAMSPIGGYTGGPSMDWVDKQRKVMGPRAFTEGVHKLGGAEFYDVYDMHAFTFPMPPDTGGTAALIDWLNRETAQYGPAKPIWFLDWGFPMAYGLASPLHVTKDQSADYAVRGMMLAAAHGVQSITYTYWGDQFSDAAQEGKGYRYKGYGIFTTDGKLRVQAKALKLMMTLIPNPPKLIEKISDGNNPGPAVVRSSDRPYTDSPFYCYKFQGKGGDEVIVAWTDGRPFRYPITVKGDKVVLYNRELLGGVVYSKDKEFGSINEKGQIVLPITGTPIFISTVVTPEQEKATTQYLRPAKYQEWKPIRGAED
jgi:hypothetical protein